jgi:hypothetical protein
MAVFSAIGAAIVGAFATAGGMFLTTAGALTLAGSVVAGVIAGGLAFATAKVLGVFDPPDLGPDPGVKIQLAPSTDNKIGIAYGRNFMSGPITDVAISNQNQTMHYCITLSEQVEGATYTVNQIFRDAANLTFSGANVQSQINANSTTDINVKDKMRIRVYAGGTASANQVFPTSGAVDATTMMPHWTNTTNYSMEDLVFAMVEIDYDAENGLTGLGALSFDVTNSVSNPGDVLIDYMNNTRYGAGLANDIIDVNSITGAANTSLKGYAAEQISYTPNTGGSATQDRWQINGYLSTFTDAGTNIAKICQASATFFMFDTKQGKFKVIPNRPTASTFSLNDDNIVSKIGVTGTELYALYNKSKVEFNDQNRRDQSNSIEISTPASELNDNEPENIASFRLDLVNDPMRATQIANIDLSQSRNGMVVTCTTDFSGMQIDVGDVVDLTNADYGFNAKEFRVMTHQEQLDDSGMITCALTLLEYNEDVYVQPSVTDSDEQGPTDIPTIPPIINLPPIIFRNILPNIDTWTTTGSGTSTVFTVFKANGAYTFVYPTTPGSGHVVGNTITVDGTYLDGVSGTNNLTCRVASVDGSGGILTTDTVTGTAVTFDDNIFGNYNSKQSMGNVAVGAQIQDKPAAVLNFSNANSVSNLIPANELDFTTGNGIEEGAYSFTSAVTPIGSLVAATANYTLQPVVQIAYANGTVQAYSDGIDFNNQDDIPSVIEFNQTIDIGPGAVSGNVKINAKNTLNPNASAQIGFTGIRYDMLKITKGDVFS